MRWRRLVATPVGTALALSSITVLAPAAFAASASSPARPDSVAASGNGSEQPATAPAPPQPPGPLPSVDELEAQMLSMVNAERAAAGAGSVQQVGWAHSVAQQHAQDMAAAGDIWHNIAGYIDRGHSALRATYLGENVAMDSTLAADDALLYSDIPHRNVTLDRRFNTVGLGIALDSRNWVYVTEDFAQIPGWAAPQAAGSANAHAAAAVPAPVARAPVARAVVAKASVVTTNKPQVVAVAPPAPGSAPVSAAAAVAVPPAPASPLVTAPAAEPITTNAVSHSSAHPGAKAGSHSGLNSGGVWILLGLAGALMAAFGGHRFRTMLARGRTQPPVATAPSPKGSPSSAPSWRQAA
jgi:uncharacterized protein YkwD